MIRDMKKWYEFIKIIRAMLTAEKHLKKLHLHNATKKSLDRSAVNFNLACAAVRVMGEKLLEREP